MVQISPPSLSSPSNSTDSDAGASLIARLQEIYLQSKDNDCAGFSDLSVSSSATPSFPSLRNGSDRLRMKLWTEKVLVRNQVSHFWRKKC